MERCTFKSNPIPAEVEPFLHQCEGVEVLVYQFGNVFVGMTPATESSMFELIGIKNPDGVELPFWELAHGLYEGYIWSAYYVPADSYSGLSPRQLSLFFIRADHDLALDDAFEGMSFTPVLE